MENVLLRDLINDKPIKESNFHNSNSNYKLTPQKDSPTYANGGASNPFTEKIFSKNNNEDLYKAEIKQSNALNHVPNDNQFFDMPKDEQIYTSKNTNEQINENLGNNQINSTGKVTTTKIFLSNKNKKDEAAQNSFIASLLSNDNTVVTEKPNQNAKITKSSSINPNNNLTTTSTSNNAAPEKIIKKPTTFMDMDFD